MMAQLRAEGHAINRKRVQRLMGITRGRAPAQGRCGSLFLHRRRTCTDKKDYLPHNVRSRVETHCSAPNATRITSRDHSHHRVSASEQIRLDGCLP